MVVAASCCDCFIFFRRETTVCVAGKIDKEKKHARICRRQRRHSLEGLPFSRTITENEFVILRGYLGVFFFLHIICIGILLIHFYVSSKILIINTETNFRKSSTTHMIRQKPIKWPTCLTKTGENSDLGYQIPQSCDGRSILLCH